MYFDRFDICAASGNKMKYQATDRLNRPRLIPLILPYQQKVAKHTVIVHEISDDEKRYLKQKYRDDIRE